MYIKTDNTYGTACSKADFSLEATAIATSVSTGAVLPSTTKWKPIYGLFPAAITSELCGGDGRYQALKPPHKEAVAKCVNPGGHWGTPTLQSAMLSWSGRLHLCKDRGGAVIISSQFACTVYFLYYFRLSPSNENIVYEYNN